MPDVSAIVVFVVALLISAGSPGPSIAAMVSRVVTKGWQDVVPFVAAMWIGEVIWMTLAVAGLAAVADIYAWAFTLIKYCGVAYLVYLAWQMWTAPTSGTAELQAPEAKNNFKMFLAGFAVTMGNPKIVIFYMALLPTLIDLKNITIAGWLILSVVTLVTLACIDIAYIMLASRARRYLQSPRALRLSNRIGATAMGGAAAFITAKS
ncbi:LysE family translocator [Kordiimonas aquimaris]|uniref:LysE family translocator n=1 Tax=Kordiimonas aquimaris TaxID=707591 RepID=UPI0021CDF572|nr:LysE family translocator [Kordiimonas aquimaris]